MGEVPDVVVARLAAPVASAMRVIVGRIPATPAAVLGRMAAPPDAGLGLGSTARMVQRLRRPAASRRVRAMPAPPPGAPQPKPGAASPMPAGYVAVRPVGDSATVDALGTLPTLVVERLLGALELTVAGLKYPDLPDMSPYVGDPPAGQFGFIEASEQSDAVKASSFVDRLYPGAADLVTSVSRRLAAVTTVSELLTVRPDAMDEPTIAAEHGRAYLALTVTTAGAVLSQLRLPPLVDRSAAVVGVALGAATLLLGEAPMPAGYAAAVLTKVRAEYMLPRHTAGSVMVSGHRFALTEGAVPDVVNFAANGLASVVDGGVVVRTGVESGRVSVMLRVLAEPPPAVEAGWEEVVEVSWRAAAGRASVVGADGEADGRFSKQAPPWPGEYRLRVSATGRDEQDAASEAYDLVVWQATAAPQVVHRRTDRLGHRLRGEPEPPPRHRPEKAYRWVRDSTLAVAATVTVVTAATAEQVLKAFGADPARPEPIREIADNLRNRGSIDPWVAVLDTADAVLAVEYNGYQGAQASVLCGASRWGRAASWYWNVNALTRLSFAEGGELLAAFEPWGAQFDVPDTVAAALDGLDFGEMGSRTGKGLVAVERFTGRGITADDLAQIEAADIGYRITAT
ncbi:DUF6461 domain-containing protein [Micromonospora sp. CPCC 206061]|uniref:DUF6461 domain-containing protein n=1 Tax=Micromonospora sp. CPCC 206061 TaxID=3122410 RepID=UPI002FEF137D